ncbi:MAG: hypothetical protein AAF984_02930 [Verrucomicrobiota bacterium]
MNTLTVELEPLVSFYGSHGPALPEINIVSANDVGGVNHDLLVHRNDMTSTLENYVQSSLRIRLLNESYVKNIYSRELVLETDNNSYPVEYGAIRIYISRLEERVQQEILEARRPLGGILNAHKVSYLSCPDMFIRVLSDLRIGSALHLHEPTVLYGRCNRLTDMTGVLLADIVEIIAPPEKMPRDEKSGKK